jgi:hypothetical protein
MLNTLEKYVSVATALSRVIWTYQKDYKGVENLMVESQEFLITVISTKGISSIINRDTIVQKMMNILRVNQAHAIYMQEGRHLDALVIYE